MNSLEKWYKKYVEESAKFKKVAYKESSFEHDISMIIKDEEKSKEKEFLHE